MRVKLKSSKINGYFSFMVMTYLIMNTPTQILTLSITGVRFPRYLVKTFTYDSISLNLSLGQ